MSNKKEIWKAISIDGKKPTVPYMISNHGHLGVSANGKMEVRQFKPTAGNYRYNTRQNGKNKALFLSKEVAKNFLKRPSQKHKFIIHKDHNYLNDHVDNLKWATFDEHRAHTATSPQSILSRKRKAIIKSTHARVLTEQKVLSLKKMIWDPKRKLSFSKLAEKFGVSEMQIYRIKSGKFWYHVKVENEPIHAKYKQNLSNISFHEKLAEKKAMLKSAAAKKKASAASANKKKAAAKKTATRSTAKKKIAPATRPVKSAAPKKKVASKKRKG